MTHVQPPSTVDTDDLQSLLSSEHARLRALFSDVIDGFESGHPEAAAQLFTALEASLVEHLQLEEEHVFPGLERVDRAEATALRAQHAEIRTKLTELGIGVDLHVTRATAIRDLVRMLDAHAAREDVLAYRWAAANLSEPIRATLRARVKERLASLAEHMRARSVS